MWPGLGKTAETVIRPPQLANNFSRREIAVKSLFAGGAKTAIQRAPGLRGDTQGATTRFRNKSPTAHREAETAKAHRG